MDSVSPNAALAEAARAVALRRLGGLRAPVAVIVNLDEHLELEKVSVELVAVNGVPVAAEPDRAGRSKGCGLQILTLLRAGPQFYSDILAEMRRRGHSETVVREHLKHLVTVGVVNHPAKGDRYALTADDEP